MVNLSRMRVLIAYEQRLQFDRLKKFAKATKITTTITGMPRGSGTGKQVEDGAIAMMEVESAYHEVIEELMAMRAELEELLPALDNPDDIAVMRLRYVYGFRLKDLPEAIAMSERTMYYHLSGAERKLIRMFPDKVTMK